jgi:hypothetical protein
LDSHANIRGEHFQWFALSASVGKVITLGIAMPVYFLKFSE